MDAKILLSSLSTFFFLILFQAVRNYIGHLAFVGRAQGRELSPWRTSTNRNGPSQGTTFCFVGVNSDDHQTKARMSKGNTKKKYKTQRKSLLLNGKNVPKCLNLPELSHPHLRFLMIWWTPPLRIKPLYFLSGTIWYSAGWWSRFTMQVIKFSSGSHC